MRRKTTTAGIKSQGGVMDYSNNAVRGHALAACGLNLEALIIYHHLMKCTKPIYHISYICSNQYRDLSLC